MMQAILIFPLPLHWLNAMRKNMGLKVVNMKRIWLRDNYSNFHDSFIAKHADNIHELCNTMTTLRDAKERWGFNESHAVQTLQWEVNKSEPKKKTAAALYFFTLDLTFSSPQHFEALISRVTSYCCSLGEYKQFLWCCLSSQLRM